MRKIIALVLVIAFLMFSFGSMIIASTGPAPNSGDGISDGSGFNGKVGGGFGGAPNSGDGISDGSGF